MSLVINNETMYLLFYISLFIIVLNESPEAQCTDTWVIDMDGDMKSCPAYISQNGNFICNDSLVNRLCCKTCAQVIGQPVEGTLHVCGCGLYN